jgi:thioredoxin reductase/Pyruvate/2-oxoacid:ferredoxin oxidoreductase delta subunit
MDLASASVSTALVALSGLLAWAHVSRRRAREGRDGAALEEKIERKLDVPRSLHPVFDTEICIGSLACLRACPERVLGIVEGVGRLVHADQCIGHGKCAFECPVGAIKLVMGTAERGVDLPEVDEHFESSRPGVYVVGELGGMGLIRNAVQQGQEATRWIAQALPAGRPLGDAVDVAIVGAGPAGLSAALAASAAGLSHRILEQDTVGGSIAHYPRQKVVMTERMKVPIYGGIGKRVIRKEKLLASWNRAIAKAGLVVEQGVKVEGIDGSDGRFELRTTRGKVGARKVILATGRRGTPRKLGVPGEELPKVAYGLVDPSQYDGARVLVVGAGDVALEAAAQLAEESRARVTISYRGESFARAREANRRRVEALAARKRIEVLFSSQVKAIAGAHVDLDHAGRPRRIANDYVLVLIGGELPLEFLKKAEVGLRRFHGETMAIRLDDVRRGSGKEDASARQRRRRTARIYLAVGAMVIAVLAIRGWGYYHLGPVERLRSPLHRLLKPAGPWGHGVGLAATAFMLSNFLYAARKRWGVLRGRGSIRSWLDFHVFVGFMSPLVIAFHAAFRSNNLLATATSAALAIVVLTGLVGRFIYGMVPSVEGHAEELEALASRFERIRERARPLVIGTRSPARLEAALALASRRVPSGSLLGLAVRVPASALRLRLRLWRVRRLLRDAERYARFRDALVRLDRLRFQIAFYNGLRRLLRGWRVFHASLAAFLVLTIAAHIAVALFVGYGWR